jgi:hypothetical protein
MELIVNEEQQLMLSNAIDEVAKDLMREQGLDYYTARLTVINEFNNISLGITYDRIHLRIYEKLYK